jgi:hypothetical protein
MLFHGIVSPLGSSAGPFHHNHVVRGKIIGITFEIGQKLIGRNVLRTFREVGHKCVRYVQIGLGLFSGRNHARVHQNPAVLNES